MHPRNLQDRVFLFLLNRNKPFRIDRITFYHSINPYTLLIQSAVLCKEHRITPLTYDNTIFHCHTIHKHAFYERACGCMVCCSLLHLATANQQQQETNDDFHHVSHIRNNLSDMCNVQEHEGSLCNRENRVCDRECCVHLL